MVFSSMHPYLDPGNWQQQQPNHQYQIGSSSTTSGPAGSQLLPPPPLQAHGSASIRPGSMADRARSANIPMAETALKCPRCDSTNTKFCYFNNYSLSQPRHFCKTCRRYWTRGGALRSVPVGGGCRRNKRSSTKATASNKSPPVSSDGHTGGSATSTNSVVSTCSSSDIIGLPSSLRFSTTPPNTLHHQLPEFGSSDMGINYGFTNNYSSSFSSSGDLPFHIGPSILSSTTALEQWRIPQTQHFPFLTTTGLEATPQLYGQFEAAAGAPPYGGSGGGGGGSHQLRPKGSAGVITQLASVKMEGYNNHHKELNLSRQLLGLNNNNSNSNSVNHHHEHYWNIAGRNSSTTSAANWTGLSGFIASSTPSNNNNPP